MTEIHHPCEILLVDDDPLEAAIVRRVLRDLALAGELAHVPDGDQALAHLRRSDREMPCIILLDLNMPKMTGIELLELIKGDHRLRDIPVVIVTTSSEERDVARSFALGAAAYVVKSPDYDEYREAISIIERYVECVGSAAQ